MEVTFLKDHLSWKAGDKTDLDEGIATYLIRSKVVTVEGESIEITGKKLTKKLKVAKKKK